MTMTPATQYATERNLAARQRLWASQWGGVHIIDWVLSLVGWNDTARVLDVGCGNGRYLDALRERGVDAVGCDLSIGMLHSAGDHRLINADAGQPPFRDGQFRVVVAAHMLYHVANPTETAGELRRVLAPGGVCIAVTNGAGHLRSLRAAVESVVGDSDPAWRMLDPANRSFSLENGQDHLAAAFDSVVVMRPDDAGRVLVEHATVITDYLLSVADVYGPEVSKPWPEIVEAVGEHVRKAIDGSGVFVTGGDVGALVCS